MKRISSLCQNLGWFAQLPSIFPYRVFCGKTIPVCLRSSCSKYVISHLKCIMNIFWVLFKVKRYTRKRELVVYPDLDLCVSISIPIYGHLYLFPDANWFTKGLISIISYMDQYKNEFRHTKKLFSTNSNKKIPIKI